MNIKNFSILLLLTLASFQTFAQQKPKLTPLQQKVNLLLAKMTLEEKVGQMAQITLDVIGKGKDRFSSDEPFSLYMEAIDQGNFIKTALGPAFQAAGITTKIILYDHNADRPDYPMSILADPDANPYVDGSALSTFHNAYPNKRIYCTEQWVGGPGNFAEDLKWHVSTLIVGATRNWSRNVLEWNLAADANYNPHTPDGGCTTCLGAITIAPAISRNVAYYVIGHASKFVRPGSVRIGSTLLGTLSNVAFKTPDGKRALIVMNTSADTQVFNIKHNEKIVTTSLPGGAAGTFVW